MFHRRRPTIGAILTHIIYLRPIVDAETGERGRELLQMAEAGQILSLFCIFSSFLHHKETLQ